MTSENEFCKNPTSKDTITTIYSESYDAIGGHKHSLDQGTGHGTVVSELNEVTKGSVLAKTGAEGVVTAALPERGLGIALKIADGSARARSVALLAILDYMGALSDEEKNKLHAHISPTIVNSRGLVVGEIRPAASWLPGLDRERGR